MKILIQRVKYATVNVDGECLGSIGRGILALAGVEKHDTPQTLEKAASKLLAYRVFPDAEGKMNNSLADTGGELLVISQFTLAADTRKGLRPSFSSAAPPDEAEQAFATFLAILRNKHPSVETGRFGADMQVELLNDGPVTFLLEN